MSDEKLTNNEKADVLAAKLVKLIRDLPYEKGSEIMKTLREFLAVTASFERLARRIIGIGAFLFGCAFVKFVEWLAS